jgi:phospholipase/carboxylesterase
MMALHIELRRAQPFAGIIGYSGRLIAAHPLAEELRSRPPVLLVHDTDHARVPFQSMMEAETVLRPVGASVETLACVGTGHSIDQEGLASGGRFLQQILSSRAH